MSRPRRFTPEDEKKLTERIVKAREKRGWTQGQLKYHLERIGLEISLRQIKRWENGESFPDDKALEALGDVYQVNPDYFKYPSGRDSGLFSRAYFEEYDRKIQILHLLGIDIEPIENGGASMKFFVPSGGSHYDISISNFNSAAYKTAQDPISGKDVQIYEGTYFSHLSAEIDKFSSMLKQEIIKHYEEQKGGSGNGQH